SRPASLRLPALGFRRPPLALRRRDGDDVQEFSVLPAALHGAVHGAAGGGAGGRESRAVEAPDPAGALHRERSARASVHRRGRAAPGQRTLRAPTNRVVQYGALIRSTRPSPVLLGACTNSSPPIAIPTCDAPG